MIRARKANFSSPLKPFHSPAHGDLLPLHNLDRLAQTITPTPRTFQYVIWHLRLVIMGVLATRELHKKGVFTVVEPIKKP